MSGTAPPSYVYGSEVSGGFTYTSGYDVEVVSGGHIYDMTIDAKAYEYVDNGGFASATIVNKGGEVDVFSGTATSTTINSGGFQSVTQGGLAYNTVVHNGGAEIVTDLGADHATTVSSGGAMQVLSGGIAYAATIAKGGTEFVTQGGTASGSTIKAGGRLIMAGDVLYDANFKATSGSAKAVGVYKNGVETITFTNQKKATYDQIVNSTTADGFERDYYLKGALKFEIERVGNEIYYISGGSSTSAVSPQYGASTADSITVQSGGSAVFASGSISNLNVMSGGTEIIGGETTVHSGGAKFKFKFTGVTVSDSVVGNGVDQIVNSGNTALSATVNAGGSQVIKNGGTATDSILNGGKLTLDTGAKLSNEVTFEGTGGELVVSGTTMPTATISGFGAGDKIQLFDVVYSAGATAKVKTAGVVTVTNGGVSYNLNIAGATVGQKFSFDSNSVLTTTAPAPAVAKMTFLAPGSATAQSDALPAMTAAPAASAAAEKSGWVKEITIPGASYALLTSAAPAIVAPIPLSGGFGF